MHCRQIFRGINGNLLAAVREVGLQLLQPHLHDIVSHLADKVSRLRQGSRKAAHGIGPELQLLASLAPHIDQPEVALCLLDALLLHLWRHSRQRQTVRLRSDDEDAEEVEVALLRAAEGLLLSCAASKCEEMK